jgi:hypothetical protein
VCVIVRERERERESKKRETEPYLDSHETHTRNQKEVNAHKEDHTTRVVVIQRTRNLHAHAQHQ